MPVKFDAKAKKNKYYYVFEKRNAEGKRVPYKKRGFRTKKEAEIAEIAKRNEVNNGIVFKPTKTLFSEYLLEWNENRRNLRESTKHTYTRMIKNHINPILGKTMLSELNSIGIERIMLAIEKRGSLQVIIKIFMT